jgi:2-oxoglutarate ferredoxin oxidoreductase subunit delta
LPRVMDGIDLPQRLWRKPLDAEKTRLTKAKINIIRDSCKGCGFCIEFCPKKVLERSDQINKKGAYPPRVVDEHKCAMCGFCTAICPDFAIYTVEKTCEEGSKDG